MRRGRAAIALIRLDKGVQVWDLMKHSPDPSVRSELIAGLAEFRVNPRVLIDRLRAEADITARRALILALGEYPPEGIDREDRRVLTETFLRAYRTERDPGLHAAVDWLLRTRWGEADSLRRIEGELAGRDVPRDRDWFINTEGQPMAIVRGPIEAGVGFLSGGLGALPNERPSRIRIDRSYALGTREVTVAQFARFLEENPDLRRMIPIENLPPDLPILKVNFFDAVRYCNWLSRREGIPEEQWCYPKEIHREMTLPADYLHRTGYRLPTDAEWEVACRAGAVTDRFFGVSVPMMDHFGWTRQNSGDPRGRDPSG